MDRNDFLNEVFENIGNICLNAVLGGHSIPEGRDPEDPYNVLGFHKEWVREIVTKIINALPEKFINANFNDRVNIQDYITQKIILFLSRNQDGFSNDVFTNFIYDLINSVKIEVLGFKQISDFEEYNALTNMNDISIQHLKTNMNPPPTTIAERETLARGWEKLLDELIIKNKLHRTTAFRESDLQKLKYFVFIKKFIEDHANSFPEVLERTKKTFLKIDVDRINRYIDGIENNLSVKLLNNVKLRKKIETISVAGYDIKINKLSILGMQFLTEGLHSGLNNKHKKQIAQKFIKHAIGNMALNKTLQSFITVGAPNNMDATLISDLNYFSYKTRNSKAFMAAAKKIILLDHKVKQGLEISEKEKLSLKEFAIVMDFSKSHSLLKKFHDAGILEGSSTLENLYNIVSRTKNIITKFETQFSEEYKPKTGEMSFTHINKRETLLRRTLSFFDKLYQSFVTRFISPYGHTAKVSSLQGKIKMTHINPNPESEAFGFREYLYSDNFSIQLDKLISSDHKKYLREKLGEDWLTILNEKYMQIETQIHENMISRFANVDVPSGAGRTRAGLADFMYRGHKQRHASDFSDIHKKVMSGYYETNRAKMLCSEFIAHTTIATMEELNSQLSKQFRLTKKNFIQIPIKKNENLALLHPGRLLKILKKKGCLVENKTSLVQKWIKK